MPLAEQSDPHRRSRLGIPDRQTEHHPAGTFLPDTLQFAKKVKRRKKQSKK
jgi:hypothetical protein